MLNKLLKRLNTPRKTKLESPNIRCWITFDGFCLMEADWGQVGSKYYYCNCDDKETLTYNFMQLDDSHGEFVEDTFGYWDSLGLNTNPPYEISIHKHLCEYIKLAESSKEYIFRDENSANSFAEDLNNIYKSLKVQALREENNNILLLDQLKQGLAVAKKYEREQIIRWDGELEELDCRLRELPFLRLSDNDEIRNTYDGVYKIISDEYNSYMTNNR